MILIDTGYLPALAQPHDALHERSLLWSQCIDDSLLLSKYVALETMNALSPPRLRTVAHGLLTSIIGQPGYEFVRSTSELWEAGLNLHRERVDKAWSLTDCISFVLMRERSIREALTHDQHFEQAGFRALLRSDPPS